MPYHLVEHGSQTCVAKQDSGEILECYDDPAEAKRYLAALEIHVTDAHKAVDTSTMRRLLADFEDKMRGMAAQVVDGDMSVSDFQINMREELRREYALMMIAGAGGDQSQVADDDWLRLGSQLQKQYRYLADFADQLASGDPRTLALAPTRAGMYARSSTAIYWYEATDVDLPAYPGDGSSECLTQCLCHWDMDTEEDEDGNTTAVLATWVLDGGEHCPTCIDRAAEWNPLRIPYRGA